MKLDPAAKKKQAAKDVFEKGRQSLNCAGRL